MLVCGEALSKFDLLSADVKNIKPLRCGLSTEGFSVVFFPVDSLSKQKREIRRCMKNPRNLILSRYASRFIGLNGYLDSFIGATMDDKMGVTELNEVSLNSMPNS